MGNIESGSGTVLTSQSLKPVIKPVDTKAQLRAGIEAARNDDRATARDLLYGVLDRDANNETAWVWLSHVVDNLDDRQVCLENVLVINPHNRYARDGLAQLQEIKRQVQARSGEQPAPATVTPASLAGSMVTAFWAGLGLMTLGLSALESLRWLSDWIVSRTFPYYITPFQLFYLTGAIAFLILSIISLNIAWALFRRHKLGYIASLAMSLILIVVGPTITLLALVPDYLVALFTAMMPAFVLFLTIMSQVDWDDGS